MNLKTENTRKRPEGFTLVELLISMLGVALMFVTLYTGVTQGFGIIKLARENLRATQILQEQAERIRTCTMQDLAAYPPTFTAPFYAVGGNTNDTLLYRGSVEIPTTGPSQLNGLDYANSVRAVTIRVRWYSGNVARQRELQTWVSRYGLQNYVW